MADRVGVPGAARVAREARVVCYFTCAREALEAPRAQLALQADVTPLISKTLLPFGRNETTTPFTKPRCGCSWGLGTRHKSFGIKSEPGVLIG